MSVLMNRWLIPIWDINGAAMAYTFSYIVYFVLLLAFIKWRIGVMALSIKLLPVALVVMVLFALDLAWSTWLTPLLSGSMFGLCVNAVLKSGLFAVMGMVALYRMKVSKSVNDLIDKALPGRKNK